MVRGRDTQGEPERAAGQPLASYQAKRDFARTPEPAGDAAPATPGGPAAQAAGPRRFVVQRHRARRLHYDLRFEIDGVLVSWAVPNGPTLDPKVKRLAVHVEDHPIEYLDFEGVIPSGEYGGGDVIVWDLGTWEPHATDDPAAAVAAGELHADVTGHKLRGRLVLIRSSRGRARGDRGGSGGRPPGEHRAGADEPEQWLLLHKDDDDAVVGWDPEDHPTSVLSGRTNAQVRADPDRMWRSDLSPDQASVPVRVSATAAHAPVEPPSVAALAELDEIRAQGSWQVYGRELRLTNLDKELFPGRDGEPPVTKRELVRYAALIAPVLLPYLTGRPLNMHRFPGGVADPGFWHKQLPAHAPDWVPRWDNPDAKEGRTTTYLVIDEAAALVWAANFGAVEWHAWTSRADHQDSPSYALIDIDPGPSTSWQDVLVLARLHRTALEHLGVRAQPKVTGRRGIQIWIPVVTGLGFADTRQWVQELSKTIGSIVPALVSWKWDVTERSGLARLDYTQNVHNKTLVAPYSPRAAPGAPVSAPIAWDELDDPALRPDGFTIRTMLDRLAARGDMFATVLGEDQVLPVIS